MISGIMLGRTLVMPKTKRIGILTGGGDCPGLNAVIRAVAKRALFEHRWKSSESKMDMKA